MPTRLCTTRLLPKEEREAAAVHAVKTYGKNLPAGVELDQLGDAGADRLSIVVNKWWGPNVDLTVGFLDNPVRELRDKILRHMNAWARDASVRFREADTDPTVRISRLTDEEWLDRIQSEAPADVPWLAPVLGAP